MGRRPRVQYQLSDISGVEVPTSDDISKILRAADEMIFVGGRSMLAKILKGSKDKKLLEKELDKCPSYGHYDHLTIEKITKIVDWMIINDYLEIDYNGRLPMIVFSDKGWQTYMPYYVEELMFKIIHVTDEAKDSLIEKLKQTNRQIILLLLSTIGESRNIGYIRFLNSWKTTEVKKVKAKINQTVAKLKS